MRILLIDDDVQMCLLIAEYFNLHDVELSVRHSGEEGLTEATYGVYDAIILDVMLPNVGGLSVLKELIKTTNTPVLMLTANGCDVDHILGLELGADDYINKPCKPKVLLARVEAAIKRRRSVTIQEKHQMLHYKNLTLDCNKREATINHEKINLTVTEFEVLLALMKQPEVALDKNAIAILALGRKLTRFDRSLDMHVSNLRKKLQAIDGLTINIKNIHGFGYKLEKLDNA